MQPDNEGRPAETAKADWLQQLKSLVFTTVAKNIIVVIVIIIVITRIKPAWL